MTITPERLAEIEARAMVNLDTTVRALVAHVREVEAKLKEAEEALKPFAKEESTWAHTTSDNYRPGVTEPNQKTFHARAEFTIGDLRRDAAALSCLTAEPASKGEG